MSPCRAQTDIHTFQRVFLRRMVNGGFPFPARFMVAIWLTHARSFSADCISRTMRICVHPQDKRSANAIVQI
jgi:hypothetical protein